MAWYEVLVVIEVEAGRKEEAAETVKELLLKAGLKEVKLGVIESWG